MFAKRRISFICFLALVATLPLASCSFQRMILKDSGIKAHVSSPADICFTRLRNGEISYVSVKRHGIERDSQDLALAIKLLLDGPTSAELQTGIGSEIPKGTVLLSVRRSKGAIVLDLSRRFSSGGGLESIESRLEQLARTVRSVAGPNVPVYLNVEGRRLSMTPGEGVEVKQPINM